MYKGAKYQEPPNHIDLSSNWEPDPEYDGFFPKGARAKSIYYSQESPDEKFIIPNHRYLFKESIDRHPAQYWCEIIDFRISHHFPVKVPPAFAAKRRDNESGEVICGTLIEWFYDTESPNFLEYKEAGDFLSLMNPDFDRKKGSHHTLQDNLFLLGNLSEQK
jgi:hypothetical protein